MWNCRSNCYLRIFFLTSTKSYIDRLASASCDNQRILIIRASLLSLRSAELIVQRVQGDPAMLMNFASRARTLELSKIVFVYSNGSESPFHCYNVGNFFALSACTYIYPPRRICLPARQGCIVHLMLYIVIIDNEGVTCLYIYINPRLFILWGIQTTSRVINSTCAIMIPFRAFLIRSGWLMRSKTPQRTVCTFDPALAMSFCKLVMR